MFWAEQAIFTSLNRNGRAGYHVVSRSPGVSEAEARAVATWSPSHGSLIVDAANRASLNLHPLPGGRLALSRTCAGPPEYSGRGGQQVYTHALILEPGHLAFAEFQPIAIAREALAHGYFRYLVDPPTVLDPVRLSSAYPRRDSQFWADRARSIGAPRIGELSDLIASGQSIVHPSQGDRVAFIECLIGLLKPELRPSVSFATSLLTTSARPFRINLVG